MRDLLLLVVAVMGTVIAAAGARWSFVRRATRLATTSRPAFAMSAALHRVGRRGRRVHCSLYALDSAPGDGPVCTFAVVTTAGLPIDGPAFPVEVRGRPVPGGLLVTRTGGRILWPARRPLVSGSRPRPDLVIGHPPEPALVPAPLDPAAPSWWATAGFFAAGCLIGPVIGTIALVLVVLPGARESSRIHASGSPAVALITGRDGDAFTIAYTVSGSPPRQATVQAEDRVVGRRYPVHVDPRDPRHVELDADPYDAVSPGGWLALAWTAGLLAAWPRVRWWLQARQAAGGDRWHDAAVRIEGTTLYVHAPPDTVGSVAAARRGPSRLSDDPIAVAGSLDPGEGFALSGRYDIAGPAIARRRIHEAVKRTTQRWRHVDRRSTRWPPAWVRRS